MDTTYRGEASEKTASEHTSVNIAQETVDVPEANTPAPAAAEASPPPGDGQAINNYSRKPAWLRTRLAQSAEHNRSFRRLQTLMRSKSLHTVCEEARCPNIHECWGEHATATFMVLGDTCTRRCRFCSVKTGLPRGVDLAEPRKVGEAVAEMDLAHVVITMVNRDDMSDGGAKHVTATVASIRKLAPRCTIEVLSSDLMGDYDSIAILCQSKAEILSHNLETVRRITPQVRSRSEYNRSLEFLSTVKKIDSNAVTKSSLMLGLGETFEEVGQAMDDLLDHQVSILNLGQYLQPSRAHLAVQRWWRPEEFAELKELALEKGFRHCEAGSLVRSSYHAGGQYELYRRNTHPLYRDAKTTEPAAH